MKICVFGAGAIGGYLAGLLAESGVETSVVARGPHLEAICASGLRVEMPGRSVQARIAASDDPAELGPQDAVIVTVKAPALPSVAAAVPPLLRPDTPVAFVMNGIPWWYFHRHGGPWEGRRNSGHDVRRTGRLGLAPRTVPGRGIPRCPRTGCGQHHHPRPDLAKANLQS
jgi:2-dehydropantoate 2-reductase